MAERHPSDASINNIPTSKRNSRKLSPTCSTAAGELKTVKPLTRLESLPLHASLATTVDPAEARKETKIWPDSLKAWGALFSGFLLMFNSWGMVNAYGTFSSYYNQQLLPRHSILQLNFVGSTQCFLVLLLSLPVGRLLDAGKLPWLVATGTVLEVAGLFGLSGVNGQGLAGQGKYGLIWVTQGLIEGLAMACFFVSSSWVVATWFVNKKSLALGIVASGASIAGVVYPVMTKFLTARLGFNHAVQCVAAVAVGTSVLALTLARYEPRHQIRKPEDWLAVKVWIDMSAFGNAAFNCLTIAVAFLFLGFYPVFFNLEEWAWKKGVGYRAGTGAAQPWRHQDALETYELLSIMNASSTVGRLAGAYLSDHLGALNVHAFVTLVASLLLFILWPLVSSVATAIAFVVVFGAFSGAVIGLPPASMAQVLGRSKKEQAKLGQWIGMMYCIAAVPALIGPVIVGHLITRYQSFLTVQCWSGACLFLAACFMMAAAYFRRSTSEDATAAEDLEMCSPQSSPMSRADSKSASSRVQV